ncbi:MAG: NAD(P)-dependent oxidoreductase [Melioribacteraceae bacterium]|nr:MAG: NAD(P)-dependent oxidoreductase [Melioribacteraceae bacterium]
MILVTGATGNLGKAILNELQKQNPDTKITAMIRDKKKAEDLASLNLEIVEASYDDKNSLLQAFNGVDKLVFISGNADTETRIKQHQNVVEAAAESGVKQVYYTSFSNPVPETKFSFTFAHTATEKLIRESGLNYTFLRNALYADLLIGSAQEAAKTGKITTASANGKVGYIPRFEIAAAIAAVVLSDKYVNQSLELANNKLYSYLDIAEILSKILGRTVTLNLVSTKAIEKVYSGMGFPQFLAEGLASSFDAIEDNEYDFSTDDFKKITGRNPIDLAGFLESAKSYFLN